MDVVVSTWLHLNGFHNYAEQNICRSFWRLRVDSHRLLQVAVKMTLLTLWHSAGICSTEVQLIINLEKSFKQITRKFKKRKSLIVSFSWFYAIRVTVCCFCQCRLARQWVNDFIWHHFTLAIIFNLKIASLQVMNHSQLAFRLFTKYTKKMSAWPIAF